MKKNLGYSIDYVTNTITITKEFNRKASEDLSGKEHILMEQFRSMNMTILYKTVAKRKTKKKVEAKDGENKSNRSTPTYKQMEKYISCVEGSEVYAIRFETIKEASKSMSNPYKATLEWFRETFPHYEETPQFNEKGEILVHHDENKKETISVVNSNQMDKAS